MMSSLRLEVYQVGPAGERIKEGLVALYQQNDDA